MPNETIDYRKIVLNQLDLAHKGEVLGQGLGSNFGRNSQKAIQERDKYSIEGIVSDPIRPDGSASLTREAFDALSEN